MSINIQFPGIVCCMASESEVTVCASGVSMCVIEWRKTCLWVAACALILYAIVIKCTVTNNKAVAPEMTGMSASCSTTEHLWSSSTFPGASSDYGQEVKSSLKICVL